MERAPFVAREHELEQLDGYLGRALAAQGMVCFVTGEAGSGKTALVTEFARRAQNEHGSLVVAIGQSDAQTGSGDSYLPFREVLRQLTGDVETKLAQGAITPENAGRLRRLLAFSGRALVEVGPDLIDIFVPWAGLATRAAAFAADKIGWLDRMEQRLIKRRESQDIGQTGVEQDHIFEQYTNVLNRLAEQQPLLLVLDDLQWADVASISLLFRLGRRIGGSHILVVGTYRPEEVSLGRGGARHPLEKVLAEFKRYFGDICVELDQVPEAEGRHFVDAIIDTEPNRLGEEFRQALHHHTSGHPLFTIELLRAMQERGDLVCDDEGRWVEGPTLDWAAFPARVEGVIEERIGRLKEDLRAILTVGSVEGEYFTAEVVARVQEANVRQLIRQLSGELEEQHHLVSARGVRRIAGHRLSEYQFQHSLFQTYLYNGLDEAERAYLHEDVGLVLEELYGDQADGMAVQLARHFEEAGLVKKAIHYLRRAGGQAADRYANEEAGDYFSRALDLAPAEGNSEWTSERYALLLAREKVYDLQGAHDAQRQDLRALAELAKTLDEDWRRAEVALRQAHYDEVSGNYPAAIASAQTAIALAQALHDVGCEAQAYLRWGQALYRQGDYEIAATRFEKALDLSTSIELHQVKAKSWINLGNVYYHQSDYAWAKTYYEQSLLLRRKTGDRQGEGGSLSNLGMICNEQGDYAGAKSYYQQALEIFREMGGRLGQGICLNNLGVVYRKQGAYARAQACSEETLQIFREIGSRQGEAQGFLNLAIALERQGMYDESHVDFQQSLDLFREIGDRQGEGEALYSLCSLYHHLGQYETAAEYGRQSVAAAKDVGDRSSLGYALTHLGHALAGLDQRTEAVAAYRQALVLRRALGQHHLAMDSLAGLASVALAGDDLAQARDYVDEILSYLQDHSLEGTEEPFRVRLMCYRVLRANKDPRASDVLRTAYRLLQEQAAKISEETLRHLFLENVPAHRAIMREFAASQENQ